MFKKALICIAGLFTLIGASSCKHNGIEKEYTMEIQGEAISARLKEDETQNVNVVHCKRGMSLYNYYIILPELEEGFVMPKHLTAKATDKEVKTIVINEKNKSETVSDHGYKFLK